jgi:hypothetical protein
MPTYTVGSGKTYDSADGILLALNDVPNDFASETEHHIIEVYPGYTYNHNMSSTKTLSNTSSSKRLIIKSADGYEHKGNFSSGITLKLNGGASWRAFNLSGNYITIKNLNLKLGAFTANYDRPAFMLLSGNCDYFTMENVLFDQHEFVSYLDWCISFQHSGGTLNYALINNCIISGKSGASAYCFGWRFFGSSMTGSKLNNCLTYNCNIGFYNNSDLAFEVNNCGDIGAGAYWVGITNITGSCNYGTPTPGPGSNYDRRTESGFQFIDAPNNNFNLRITSPNIGSGSDVITDNPRDIRGNLWQGNHRSPFNNIIITNAYMQPPEDTEYIRGNWMNGMIYNCLQPAGKIIVGDLTNLGAYGSHVPSYDYAGFSTKCDFFLSFNTLLRPINGKFLTISTLIKRFNGGGLNSIAFGKDGTYLNVDTSATNRIRFTIDTDYYADSTSLSSYVDVSDYFNVICQVNLEATTNAERIKIYLYQKGFLHHVALTFTGTAPSTFNETSGNWTVGYHRDYQGITSVWDRLLAFEEIYTIAYDPYVIYRSDKKLFRMLNIIPEGLGNGLWFLRKFIIGN